MTILDKFHPGEVKKGSIVDFDPERDLADISIVAGQLTCGGHETVTNETWCAHLQRILLAGADADLIYNDSNIVVPVFPSVGIHAQVNIEPAFGGGGGDDNNRSPALMSLRFSPDMGRPYSVPLGFWNYGEGRASIRSVIIDYLKSHLEESEDLVSGAPKPMLTRCPSSTHSLGEQRWLDSPRHLGDRQRIAWDIVMEKACTACVELTAAVPDDNFGIDDTVVTKPRWS